MSQQNAATPRAFLDAVEAKFGVKFVFDLACTTQDCIVPVELVPAGYPRGYYFDQGVNALDEDWSHIAEQFQGMDLDKIAAWCNCPFKQTAKFAKKCSEGTDRFVESDEAGTEIWEPGIRIFSVFPIGACTEWFAAYVLNKAAVYLPRPRLTFLDPRTGLPFMTTPKVSKRTGELLPARPQTGLSDVMLVDWAGEPGVYEWRWKEKAKRGKK